jgi:hypothetical protein
MAKERQTPGEPMDLGNMRELGVTQTRRVGTVVALCVVVAMGVASAQAEPTFQLDASSKRVMSLSNLYTDPSCDPRPMRGKVVKRDFEEDGIVVSSFVLELPDGTRDLINVGVDLNDLSMNARGWIVRGLQTLLAVGHEVAAVVDVCGVSGHILMLDAVREVPPWER